VVAGELENVVDLGDRGAADKGRRSFLRHGDNKNSITQEVLAVNVYLVCNSNDCGRC
jgi:hypothetical protein